MNPKFRLRFPTSEVVYWAARYAYADDSEVEEIGSEAGRRGWYTRDQFLTVTRWKTKRSRSRCERNDEPTIVELTRLALSTPDERQRIESLTQLHGVQFPTASVLLHLAHRDRYPIIDYRALWSLGIETSPASYSFGFWWAYTEVCRSLADAADVPMRTLDRALWQYSKERQVPGSGGQVRLAGAVQRLEVQSRQAMRQSPAARETLEAPPTLPRTMEEKRMSRSRRCPYRADIHARLIETAAGGGTITYSELVRNRRMVGSFLYRIAKEEEVAGRPPLTALVVHKVGGKPGPGFLEAAKWVGFWRSGETEDQVWRRAVAEVHEYWRPKLTDDLDVPTTRA